ncbi:MAG: hypothetical protein LBV80_08390 [Deltaproteobacteria bacterium]|jgi:uncharacterized membrane protein YkvI|nr:hypothetical protein [Deltaproteobacteria bacterium]
MAQNSHSTSSTARLSLINVIKLAGAYCAFCIGSGFASGQEARLFFAAHGLYSFGALAISLILFMWFGSAVMLKGHQLRTTSTSAIFRQYCGKHLGYALEAFILLFLFSVVVIMISGAGATMTEYYGLNPYVGRVLMAAASTLAIIFGLRRLITIIGFIGPLIIAICLAAGIAGILHNPDGITEAAQNIHNFDLPKAAPHWALSGLLYTAFMVVGSAPFFSGLGTAARNPKEALYGGILGGFLLIGAAAILSTGILANLEEVFDKEMPALAMAGAALPWLADIFAVILLLGIFFTAAPMLWSVCNRFAPDGTPRFRLTALILGVAAFFGGLLPFGQLVAFVYPKTGVIGLFFMICVLLHPVIKKYNKKD